LGHAHMRGFVTVLAAEEFQKWMDSEQEKLKGESDIFR
jgi:heme/copper-type cytochrome/quinol oxidase subunit 2